MVGLKGVAVWRRKRTKWLRILVERVAAAADVVVVVAVVVVVVVGGAVFLGMMSSACRSGHYCACLIVRLNVAGTI